MTTANYTLEAGDKQYKFHMANVDFSAPIKEMARGLGETVVDSLYNLGVTNGRVAVHNPDGSISNVLGAYYNPEGNRDEQIIAIGLRITNATYKALKGAA